MRRRIARTLLTIVAALAVAPTADAGRSANSCPTPGGDLNTIFGTPDAFVTPFCTEVPVGSRWRTGFRVQVAGDGFVFPTGYQPSTTPLDADFLAKLVELRVIVDGGTRQERVFAVTPDELLVQRGELPDGSRFVRVFSASLHPLRPGGHTVQTQIVLAAEHWDGFGAEPGVNGFPVGVSTVDTIAFTVVKRHR